jgi:hypothetical protein
MLVEPPAIAGDVLEGPDAPRSGDARLRQAPGTSFYLSARPVVRSPNASSALAAAGLAASVVGLLGSDSGALWLIAGVWTVRAMARAPVGFGWGVACLGAAARWGTIGLGDVAVATRLGGPTITAGPVLVRAGMLAALVGAVIDEARGGGLLSRAWGERAAAAGAIVALAALFLVRGPADPRTTLPVLWGASSAALTMLVLVLRPAALRLPAWAAPSVAFAGVIMATALV